MAKKTLKSALRAHEAKRGQAARQQAVEEAAKRKLASIGVANASASKKADKKRRRDASERGVWDGNGTAGQESNLTSGDGVSNKALGKRRERVVEPDDTILLVGEGNFSFAHALLQPPHSHPPHLVLATAFDTEEQCYSKYPDAREHVAAIRSIAGRDSVVAFGVDAGNLLASRAVSAVGTPSRSRACWSKIIFNFPHVGAGHKDETRNIMANQLMLLRFFVSAAPLLTQGAVPLRVAKALGKKVPRSLGADDADSGGDDSGRDDPSEKDSDEDEGLQDDDPGRVDREKTNGQASNRDTDKPGSRFIAPARAGSILVTIRHVKPYTLWDVSTLAKRVHSVLPAIAQRAPALPRGQKLPTADDLAILADLASPSDEIYGKHNNKAKQSTATQHHPQAYRVWRSFVFDPAAWPGYSHRRTVGWRDGLSTGNNEDIVRAKAHDDDDERGECRTFELALQL